MTGPRNRETPITSWDRGLVQGDPDAAIREIRELRAACVRAEEALEAAQKACNICGRPWPNHYENCAYPKNVDRAVRAEEALQRVDIALKNAETEATHGATANFQFVMRCVSSARDAISDVLAAVPEENQ